jgi:hypothetical protein
VWGYEEHVRKQQDKDGVQTMIGEGTDCNGRNIKNEKRASTTWQGMRSKPQRSYNRNFAAVYVAGIRLAAVDRVIMV